MTQSYIRTNVRVTGFSWLLLLITCAAAQGQSPAEIYQQRIIPLLRAETPSSCRECHFQAVDLKEFMSDDPAATFAQLRAHGWIDTDNPGNSKLLSFVNRSSDTTTDLQAKVRERERAALTAWIAAASSDPELLAVPLAKPDDLQLDRKLIGHTRHDALLDRFVSTIWSQLERCANCHSPDRNAKQVEKNGERMSWIVPKSPDKTLALLRERQLINIDDPQQSLIRTKPLALVEHGAGIKFPEGGETDLAWTAFLEDAARVWTASYKSSKELQATVSRHAWRTGLHLRVSSLPESTIDQLITIALLPESDSGHIAKLVSYAESRVQPARSWSNSLSVPLSAAEWQKFDAKNPPLLTTLLPPGRYSLVIYDSSALELFKAIEAGHSDQLRIIATCSVTAPWTSGHANSLQLSLSGASPSTLRVESSK